MRGGSHPWFYDQTSLRRRRWGPVRIVDDDEMMTSTVTLGDGTSLTVSGKVRERNTYGIGLEGSLEVGLPVLAGDERVGVAVQHNQRDWSGVVKPGRIWFEGVLPQVFTPGLRAQGHVLPNQLTLRDDQGWLVRSRWLVGMVNLDFLPVLVGPRVHERAVPEHIALWVVSWRMFNGTF